MRGLVWVLGWVVGAVARLWLWTLRMDLVVHPSLEGESRPWVLSFWHGSQFPLLAWKRRRKTAVLVSLSRDGELQASALSLLGFDVVRGSSSRGGARALAMMIRRLRRDQDCAFAVDGPKGPVEVAKPGAVLAARAAGAVLVPLGSACPSGTTLGAWDRYRLPWPFSRVRVVLGAPISPVAHDARALLEQAIADVNREAASLPLPVAPAPEHDASIGARA